MSYLYNLGLTEWMASTPQDYIRIATSLAGDLPHLSQIRSELREDMRRSPLMDAPAYTRNLEQLYHRMWHTWCGASIP